MTNEGKHSVNAFIQIFIHTHKQEIWFSDKPYLCIQKPDNIAKICHFPMNYVFIIIPIHMPRKKKITSKRVCALLAYLDISLSSLLWSSLSQHLLVYSHHLLLQVCQHGIGVPQSLSSVLHTAMLYSLINGNHSSVHWRQKWEQSPNMLD